MTQQFFNQINYSASNEDGQAELLALELSGTDRVLCITGSGARTLDLLTAAPREVCSVDFNPTQNHLLALKLAAYQILDYRDFLSLIGIQESDQRPALLAKVMPQLPADSQTWWQKHNRKVDSGVIYCGTWEKLLRWMSKTTVLRKRKIDGLWHAADLDAQQRYWQQNWTGPFLKNFLRLLANRFLWTKVIREPGAMLIPRGFDVGGYLYACLERMAHHSLIRENPYANLLFRGRYTDQCVLPLHLREENFEQLKLAGDRVKIVSKPIDEFLSLESEKFDAYSLSDLASYAPPETYDRIWTQVVQSAAPNAKFCERFFLVDLAERGGKQDWGQQVSRDPELEKQLARIDHTCLYSFRAGLIAPR